MRGQIRYRIAAIVYSVFRHLPVKKDRVLLFSYYGEQFGGAPKYIDKYIRKNNELDVVWAFVEPEKYKKRLPGQTIVRYGHTAYYYMLATSGTIITDYRMTAEFEKRPQQRYIQTWHSSLRLKQIEKDAVDTLPETYVRMAIKDSQQIDVLLAGSKKSKEIFQSAFWYDGVIAETGTPQCDILIHQDQSIREKVLQYYGIPAGSHVAMYAPTFRKNHDTSVYDLDANAVLKSLYERFGGEWYLLVRLHPHLKNDLSCFTYSERIIQATDYDDVQELLCATDFLISDYSAIMFDYSVTGKPCILYTPDLEEYIAKDRKFYFEMRDLPFDSVRHKEDLAVAIEQFNQARFDKRIKSFRQSIGSYDDGNACRRVIHLIMEGR